MHFNRLEFQNVEIEAVQNRRRFKLTHRLRLRSDAQFIEHAQAVAAGDAKAALVALRKAWLENLSPESPLSGYKSGTAAEQTPDDHLIIAMQELHRAGIEPPESEGDDEGFDPLCSTQRHRLRVFFNGDDFFTDHSLANPSQSDREKFESMMAAYSRPT